MSDITRIVCEIDGVFPDKIPSLKILRSFGENAGFGWAEHCRKAGLDVVKCNCAEGGICSADETRQIRLEDFANFRDDTLKQYARGYPFVEALICRGEWTKAEVFKVGEALKKFIVKDIIKGDDENVKLRFVIER